MAIWNKIMHTVCKSVLIVIGIFILIMLVAVIRTARFVDISNEDLVYQRTKIDDSINAYEALLPALNKIREGKFYEEIDTEKMLKNDDEADYDEFRMLIERHQSFLPVLSAALELDMFQVPEEKDFLTPREKRYTSELSFLQKIQYIYIRHLLHEGDIKKALQEILKLYKYGYFLQNSDGSFIYYTMGTIVKSRALNLIDEWIPKTDYGAEHYKKILRELEKYAPNDSMADSLRVEYMVIANTLTGMCESEELHDLLEKETQKMVSAQNLWHVRYTYNINATINAAGRYFRQEIRNLTVPYANIRHLDIPRRISSSFIRSIYFLAGNSVGKLLLEMTMPHFDGRVEQKIYFDAQCILTRLHVALKAYYADKGILPETLTELTSGYINVIPRDPFNDKDLIYSKSRKMIYCVDKDLKDNGGDKEKDICIELGF